MASLLFSALKQGLLASYSCTRDYAIKSASGGSLMSLGKGKKKDKVGAVVEKIVIPVETDATKLVSYCCGSNILINGQDVKLKPDSEYPEWLWTMRTGRAPTLDEMDPTTKEYWLKVRTLALRRNNRLRRLRKFK